MSDTTPEDQTATRHTTRTAAAVLALAAAVLVAGCDPATGRHTTRPTPGAGEPVPAGGSVWGDTTIDGRRVVFSADCDAHGTPHDVTPDTPDAHRISAMACQDPPAAPGTTATGGN